MQYCARLKSVTDLSLAQYCTYFHSATNRFVSPRFELPRFDLVDVATHQPAVYEDGRGASLFSRLLGVPQSIITGEERTAPFGDLAFDWYEEIDLLDRWVTADGPPDWP